MIQRALALRSEARLRFRTGTGVLLLRAADNAETWTSATQEAETWTNKTVESEGWTEQ